MPFGAIKKFLSVQSVLYENFPAHYLNCVKIRNIMGSVISSKRITDDTNTSDDGVRGPYVKGQGNTDSTNGTDVIVAEVCSEDDLKDGEMKEFQVGTASEKILLVKEKGQFHALGTKCTHYGAPLVKGAFSNGQIICPWHGACFNSSTGDIEDYPGLDSLPKHKVSIEDGRVKVEADKKLLKSNKRRRGHCEKMKSNNQTFLIIGGGGAAASCVEELRYKGFTGSIIMATQESYLPYDRPKLSKALDTPGSKLALRSEEFYNDLCIEVQLNKMAVDVNVADKEVKFSDDTTLNFDKLVVATGGTPRKHSAPGNDLKNVCYLRSPDDGNYIAKNGIGKNVVIIGNSFIAMEIAAYFAEKAKSTTIVARKAFPFSNSLGTEIGTRLKQLFEAKEKINFCDGRSVIEFIGEDGVLNNVKLDDETILEADICIVGIGVVPSTHFLKNSGIKMNEKDQIVVNEYLQTTHPDVYAAGDIVEFPLAFNDCEANIGHWQLASYHGKVAACNILDQKMKIDTIPFFWCMLFGKSVRFAGYNHGYTDVIIDGNLEKLEFAAYYLKDDIVVAVASMNMGPISSEFSALLKLGKKLTREDIRNNPKGWMK